MGSVTSCFNSTLYRKTMARFWPLWALYGLIWLFAIPLNLLNRYFDVLRWSSEVSDAQEELLELAQGFPSFLTLGVSLSLVFGVLCAMAVFGYLYSGRSACMMHALPMRRETLFTTSYLAGLSFLLLPHLAVAAVTAAVELAFLSPGSWGSVLPALGIWLLAQSGTALFFFSFAAFCAMFTGNILALPVFYGILNGLVIVVASLIAELMSQLFYGCPGFRTVTNSALVVKYCTPAYALSDACGWSRLAAPGAYIWQLNSPLTVAAYAAAGLVFAVLALLVYRCRHVESAGDVVAIALVRPIFKYGVSFCSGLCLGMLTFVWFGWAASGLSLYVGIILWAAAGYFVAEMLLKKSFRVLRTWKGAAAMAVLLAALCLVFHLDLFGIESRVPDGGDVASLTVDGLSSYPYDSGRVPHSEITDPELIQQFIDLHRAVIAEKDRAYDGSQYQAGDDSLYLFLTYTLKDGSTLTRRYFSVPVFASETDLEGSVTWAANRLVKNPTMAEQAYDFGFYEQGRLVEAFLNNAYNRDGDYFDTIYLDGSAQELWQAVRRDFAEGTIGAHYLFDDNEYRKNTYITDLCFSWEIGSGERSYTTELYITLTPNARNTLAVLEQAGALDALQPEPLLDGSGDEIPYGDRNSTAVVY